MSTAKFQDATTEEINQTLEEAYRAFLIYRNYSLKQRADFMYAIAGQLERIRTSVVPVAMRETNLPEARMNGELSRTIFQLNSYADAAVQGDWLEARIDTALPDRKPASRPDLRKMLIPLGPVVVFGASNFPFAYSTAGGDTACAFAAGCPVIVKAHPAHAETSDMVAGAIWAAAEECKMPEGIFGHVHGASFEAGSALVMHPRTKAVGFTGSLAGGRALFDMACRRGEPIPVFAEMGSINPVFLLPGKMKAEAADVAKMYAASITQGVGQFCTNPGLIFGIEGEGLQEFIHVLAGELKSIPPGHMLHKGIAKSYSEKRAAALEQHDVHTEAVSSAEAEAGQGIPTVASASAAAFLNNPVLHQEVFGPYSLIIKCKDKDEMLKVARHTEGQLTSTLMATEDDVKENEELYHTVQEICGRLIMNGVPTGVEVSLAMHHGGPYPATTDSRFTSVGPDGIKRFARPLCFQNVPDALLPAELQNSNPLGIWRTVNDQLTKDKI
jgi:NADP-dependent aldehyde dehydrogenase